MIIPSHLFLQKHRNEASNRASRKRRSKQRLLKHAQNTYICGKKRCAKPTILLKLQFDFDFLQFFWSQRLAIDRFATKNSRKPKPENRNRKKRGTFSQRFRHGLSFCVQRSETETLVTNGWCSLNASSGEQATHGRELDGCVRHVIADVDVNGLKESTYVHIYRELLQGSALIIHKKK